MFSLKQKTLRKITVDNSVKYIAKSEQTKLKNIKPDTKKASSLLKKSKQQNFTKQ